MLYKNFIFDDKFSPPECHASTILKTGESSFLCAWFAGEKEGKDDVKIWLSEGCDGKWSAPVVVADGEGIPLWNPVLFENDGKISLYYKIGKEIATWQTMMISSNDKGKTWSEPVQIAKDNPKGGRGPVKNKPIRTKSGKILCPGSTEDGVWKCFVDILTSGDTYIKKEIPSSQSVNMIQPTLWQSADGTIHALMRTNSGKIYKSISADDGESWEYAKEIEMPNNNSGIDCTITSSGKVILVCNPISENWGSRSILSVFSSDDGEVFTKICDLENENEGEFSYPAIISEGNKVYITYTHLRKNIVFCELEIL